MCSLGRNGKGLRETERAAGFIRHLPRSYRRREARTGAAPHTGTAASHASLGGAQRCAAKLQRDHNSSDHNEGDGSHPTLSHPIPQGTLGTSLPAAGERGTRRERRRCGLRDEPSPDAAHRAPAGCGDVKQRECVNGYGIAQCGDGSGDTGQRGHRDDSEDVGQHDAGMAAGMQGRADA